MALSLCNPHAQSRTCELYFPNFESSGSLRQSLGVEDPGTSIFQKPRSQFPIQHQLYFQRNLHIAPLLRLLSCHEQVGSHFGHQKAGHSLVGLRAISREARSTSLEHQRLLCSETHRAYFSQHLLHGQVGSDTLPYCYRR